MNVCVRGNLMTVKRVGDREGEKKEWDKLSLKCANMQFSLHDHCRSRSSSENSWRNVKLWITSISRDFFGHECVGQEKAFLWDDSKNVSQIRNCFKRTGFLWKMLLNNEFIVYLLNCYFIFKLIAFENILQISYGTLAFAIFSTHTHT